MGLDLEAILARLEALWPGDLWDDDWLDRLPEGPREKRLAFALFALLVCVQCLDDHSGEIDPSLLSIWRQLEWLAYQWAGMTESQACYYFFEGERQMREDLLSRFPNPSTRFFRPERS